MNLQDKLTADMKTAMKEKNQVKLDTIRFLMSQLKNLSIDKGSELTDQEVQQLIAKQVKQQNEVISQYKSAGRDDLVESESAQVAILETYLPAQLSAEELSSLVAEAIKDQPNAPMGQIIGSVTKQAQGKVDGSRVAAEVKSQLSA